MSRHTVLTERTLSEYLKGYEPYSTSKNGARKDDKCHLSQLLYLFVLCKKQEEETEKSCGIYTCGKAADREEPEEHRPFSAKDCIASGSCSTTDKSRPIQGMEAHDDA